jgi:hypothetical protein
MCYPSTRCGRVSDSSGWSFTSRKAQPALK